MEQKNLYEVTKGKDDSDNEEHKQLLHLESELTGASNIIHRSELAKLAGNIHYKNGNFLKAIKCYNESLKGWNNTNALNNRSMACNFSVNSQNISYKLLVWDTAD